MGSIAKSVGDTVTKGLEIASGAVVAFANNSVEVGKQFDAAMANVAAISGATGDALNDLREKAIAMGGSTRFSATEAADALGYMAMAGWEPQEMMDGLKGVMDLAAASGEGLARVSDIVTDALTAFGLEAEDSAHFADVLAVASSAANTNVSMMGETFKYVAPLAGTLGYQIEDMAVSIGLMANAGIKASQAGTSLRAGLSKLVKPTDDAISKLKELGLTVQNMSDEEIAAKTAALEQSVTAREQAYSEEEEVLQESLDRQYDALKKSLDARYNAAKETYDNEYDALKKSLDKQYSAQKETFDEEYDERKKALDKSYEAAKDTYDKQYEERKKYLESEYDALEKTLYDEVDAFQRAQEEELEKVQKAQEAQVKEYEQAAEAKIAAIDEVYKQSLKNTDEEEYRRLQELDNQIAAIEAQSEAAAKAAEEEERRQRRAELQKAINTADSAEKRMEAEQKLANYNESIRRKDAEAQRKADIADLKAQKDAVKAEAKAERDAAKETRDADIKEAKATRDAELEALKESQKDELDELKRGQKDELNAQKAARKEQLDAAKEANAQDLKELKALNEWRLSTIKELHDNELKSLKKSHEEQLDAMKEANDDQLSDLKKAQSNQLSAMKEGNEDKLKEAKRGYSKQLDALKDAHKAQLKEYKDSVKQQTEELKKQGEARAAVLTDDKGNTRDFIEVVETLREKFKDMSEAEKTSAAAAIFGQEAMSGWLAMINASDEDFNDLKKQISQASTSNEKFAETMEANGFSADAMRESMALLGVTQEEFDDALKESNGKVKDFRDALLAAADSGTTLDDIDNNLTISGDALTKVFGEMSAAAIMAGTHEDSLAGSTTTLDSAIETLRIRIADKLNPTIREFTEFAQNSVVSLTDAFEREESIHKLSDAIRDTEGNLLSAGQIAGVLSETLYSMSEDDRQIAIREIFGTDDIDYVNSLLDENGEKWDELLGYVSQIDAVAQSSSGLSGMMDALAPIISDGIGMILEYLPKVVIVGGQILGALVDGIIDNLPLLATGVTQIVTELGSQLLNAAPDIAAKGEELLNFLADGITENVDTLVDTALKVIETFSGYLVKAIPVFAKKATDIIVALAMKLSDPKTLTSLTESAIKILGSLAQAIVENLPRLTETAWKVIMNFAEYLDNNLPRIMEAGFDFLITFINGVMDKLPDFIARLPEIIQGFLNYISDNLPMVLDKGIELLDSFITGILEAIPALIAALPDIIVAITDFFVKNFPLIVTKGGELLGRLIVGIIGAIPQIALELPKVIEAIGNALRDGWSVLKDAGAYLLEGLWAGIADKIEWLQGKVIGVVDTIKEWFTGKDGFDENSPSKWSEKVFRNVLKGGEIGLDNGLPDILSNAENAVKDIQDALSADPFSVSGGYSMSDMSGGYSFATPRLAAAGATYGRGQITNPVPVNFTVVNEIEAGGVKYERRQRKYRISEDKRNGASLVKL